MELTYNTNDYDLDGLLRLVDLQEATLVLMYYDEDDNRYYQDRIDTLELNRGINYIIQKIEYYLEEEDRGVFIPVAAIKDDMLWLLDGRSVEKEELNLGSLELAQNEVYGVMLSSNEEEYIFTDTVYYDGMEKDTSSARFIDDAGVLEEIAEGMIKDFA